MRKLAGYVGVAACVAGMGASNEALAENPLNPALSRFVVAPECHFANDSVNFGRYNDSVTGQLQRNTGRTWCAPDNAQFKRLMNQWGFALAPSAMHSARTTGFGGFHFSAEASYTSIDNDASYWKDGTRGPTVASTGGASFTNASPPDLIQQYTAKVRKGFGFGLELTTAVGFVPQSTILTGGADVRMSLLEGFRTGVLGIFPDVAVGGGVRTITGTPEFQLTTVGVDVQISKPLTISSVSQLTPWIGYQYLWIFADSGLIDLTPAEEPLGYCGYQGNNVNGNPNGSAPFDGQPVCAGGSPVDFNNNVVFDNARLERQRLMFGLNYRYEVVMFGAQFITDIVSPADAQVGDDTIEQSDGEGGQVSLTDKDVLEDVPRQWTLMFELGAMF